MRVLMWPSRRSQELNPYAPILTAELEALGVVVDEFSPRRALAGRYDVVHVHWPDAFFDHTRTRWRSAASAVARLLVLAGARLRGARLFWTVHNLDAHESRHPDLAHWYMGRFTAMVDGWASLTAVAQDSIVERHPRLRDRVRVVARHPHYRGAYGDAMSRADARRRLGIDADAPVALCFGQVRPYKRIPELVRTFTAIEDDGLLLVAGAVADDELRRSIERSAGDDRRVRLHFGPVADDDVQQFLRACDLVVVPQPAALNSGVALLALGFDRPLLAADGPATAELVALAGEQWVAAFDPPLTADALRRTLQRAVRGRDGGAPDLSAFEPARVAQDTYDAYRRLTGAR